MTFIFSMSLFGSVTFWHQISLLQITHTIYLILHITQVLFCLNKFDTSQQMSQLCIQFSFDWGSPKYSCCFFSFTSDLCRGYAFTGPKPYCIVLVWELGVSPPTLITVFKIILAILGLLYFCMHFRISITTH